MKIKTFEVGALAGLIVGSAIGAAAMYFAQTKKVKAMQEKLEADYQELRTNMESRFETEKEEIISAMMTTEEEANEEIERSRDELFQEMESIIKDNGYATPEEVTMEGGPCDMVDIWESIEDSVLITQREFEQAEEDIDRFEWYYDRFREDLTEESGEQVKYYIGEMLNDIIEKIEQKDSYPLGVGDDFYIRNDSHGFVANIVITG